jgi:hypothetical protein
MDKGALRRAAVRARSRALLPYGGDYCAMPDCEMTERLHIVEFDVNRFVACSNCRRRLGLDGRKAIDRNRFPNSVIGCVVCRWPNPHCWEIHHIDGRNRSDRCTALCLVHHEIISEIQKDDPLTDGVSDIRRLRNKHAAKTGNPLPQFLWWHEGDNSTVFEISSRTDD